MGKKNKNRKQMGVYKRNPNDTSISAIEIIKEARLEKLKEQEETRRRNSISFTYEAIKAFASGVKFKKEQPKSNPSDYVEIQREVSATAGIEKESSPRPIALSPYDHWYEMVTAEQKEETSVPMPVNIKKLSESVTEEVKQTSEPKLEEIKQTSEPKFEEIKQTSEPKFEEIKQTPSPTVNINYDLIKSVFKDVSASYKYFWFLSLLSMIKRKGHSSIPLSEMSAEMIALAWPYIYTYGLDFGKGDSFKKIAGNIVQATSLTDKSTTNTVRFFINDHYSMVKKIISPLLENVPYRFLSPWIKFVSKEDVIQKSNEESYACPYAFMDDSIVFDEDWFEYFHNNLDKLEKFAKSSLLEYLKKHNSEMALLKYKVKESVKKMLP